MLWNPQAVMGKWLFSATKTELQQHIILVGPDSTLAIGCTEFISCPSMLGSVCFGV